MQTKTQIPTKTELLLFGPFTIFLKNFIQIHAVVFALKRQINKQTVCENNLLCAGYKIFVKYQAQGGLTPNPPLAYGLEFKITFVSNSFLLNHPL